MAIVSNNLVEKSLPYESRIATLDFTRGFAIFLMTFFHGFNHVFDPTWFTSNPSVILTTYNPVFIAPLIFLVYLGTWNSFFLLVSISVNTLGMVKEAQKGVNLEKSLLRKFIIALFLFGADFIIESLLYYGYFGNGFRTGIWSDPSNLWLHLFAIRTLKIIAWSLIITSIINYFILRKNGQLKFQRNMIIYALLTLIIIISTQFVQNWVDNMPWIIPPGSTGWPNIGVQQYNASFKAWFFSIVAGDLEPFFPYLATGFVGVMIGFTVGQPKPSKYFPPIFGTLGLLSMIIGVILMIFGFPIIFDHRSSIAVYLLQIGGQVGMVMVFFRIVEFKGKSEWFAKHWFVKPIRRWSMITLSIYALEIYDLMPQSFLNMIAGQYIGHNFFEKTFQADQIGYALLVGIFSIFWYEALIRLWAKINFIGSFEWFLIKIQSGTIKHKSNRLNEDLILNKVKWIDFNDKKEKLELLSTKETSTIPD